MVDPLTFQDLGANEAALLPGAEEAHGRVRRFQIAPRLTSHVRHRTKYLDMPSSTRRRSSSRVATAADRGPGR
jgi:hypothetical protein